MVGVEQPSDSRAETPEKGRSSDGPPAPPPDRPGSPGQPSRLESRAAARTPPEAATEAPTTNPNIPDAAEAAPPKDEPTDTADSDRDRDKKTEEEPESPSPEETDQDKFAALPTRADLDPASTTPTPDQGDPLPPVDEDRDLSEPEDADKVTRLLRRTRENPDDAENNLDNLISNMDKALERPPSGTPVSSQDTSIRGDALHGGQHHDVQGASALVGAAVIAMLAMKAAGRLREHGGRDDSGHR